MVLKLIQKLNKKKMILNVFKIKNKRGSKKMYVNDIINN